MRISPPLPYSLLLLAMACATVNADEPAPLQPPSTASTVGSPATGSSAADIRVQLIASQRTVLSSELAGKIISLDVKEGESFKKGERLVAFDCAIHQARLNHSTAAESAASKKLMIAKRLDQLQSISVADVAQAEAALAMARAESGVGRVMLQRCSISAPFSGRIAERKVQPGEYVAEGKELLAIYDNSAFDVELIAPSRWLTWLKPGSRFQVSLDETGKSYPAEVVRMGSVIDPLSQSVKVFGRIAASDASLLPGMSGTAQLAPPIVSAK
ncbi:efflux RND transporter periplasmic adaptor subunit [Pseudomonas viridiflava]|uniref:efflux RND transporter periplasmic adaptor subunit n=1 Tax=Pseudomonas viridiflava TaxID=33069 RepID=UPI0019688B79|nr:efflux RND transporter periplasmic adaptor subunit [Pseudomonas viridiflava]